MTQSATLVEPPAIEGAQTRSLRAYQRLLNLTGPLGTRLSALRALTSTQVRLLYLLGERDERSVGEIADDMDVRPSAVTALTDRLVAAGLIERRRDAGDRRVVRIALTEHGIRTLQDLERARVDLMRALFANVPEERFAQLAEIMEELAASAEEYILTRPIAEYEDLPAAG